MAYDFKIYTAEDIRKINSQRRVQSAPGDKTVPILDEAGILFSSAKEAHDEPRSCVNCPLWNYGRSCMIHAEHIVVRKFIWPKRATADAKRIEYWPVCGYWMYGQPNYGPPKHVASIDPDTSGLGWVNAPEVGLEHSGSCCGGRNGGDECDLWITKEADAREADSGFCRVLQKDTANMDCCGAWEDDDWVYWQTAQERLRELEDGN